MPKTFQEEVTQNAQKSYDRMEGYADYVKFCDLAANSNLSAHNLAGAFFENPNATEAGTMTYWNKRGQNIKPGEKGTLIMMPSERGFDGGRAFDVSQTQPKPWLIDKVPEYHHNYLYTDDQAGEFMLIFRSANSDLRVAIKDGLPSASQLQGKLINLSADLTPLQQAQETILQYHHRKALQAAELQETKESPEETKMKAVTAAYISGKKLGFTMPLPYEMVNTPGKEISLNDLSDRSKALTYAVEQSRKFHDQISKEIDMRRSQQMERTAPKVEMKI